MKDGFGVEEELNLRFLMEDCKMEEYDGEVGKKVAEEIGGMVGSEWSERH